MADRDSNRTRFTSNFEAQQVNLLGTPRSRCSSRPHSVPSSSILIPSTHITSTVKVLPTNIILTPFPKPRSSFRCVSSLSKNVSPLPHPSSSQPSTSSSLTNQQSALWVVSQQQIRRPRHNDSPSGSPDWPRLYQPKHCRPHPSGPVSKQCPTQCIISAHPTPSLIQLFAHPKFAIDRPIQQPAAPSPVTSSAYIRARALSKVSATSWSFTTSGIQLFVDCPAHSVCGCSAIPIPNSEWKQKQGVFWSVGSSSGQWAVFTPLQLGSADQKNRDFSGYQYAAMSSMVLTADRSKIPRRDNEPTSEPETLVGRIDSKSMGSCAFTDRRSADVIKAIQEIKGLNYKPQTNETRSIYELLLSSVQLLMGNQPNEIVRSATDMTIEAMKNDNDYPKDLDKKRTIKEFLGTISSERFNELSNLCKKLTDYGDEDQAQQGGAKGEEGDGQKRANELDDNNNGVAVVFEDDENGDESDEDDFEIRDNSDSEEDTDEEENDEQEDSDFNHQQIDPTDLIIIGPDSNDPASSDLKKRKGKHDLTIYNINGFWLQRLIGSHFPDPIEAESKTKEVINLLSANNSSLRDLENSLVDLFDYNKFELVSVLTKYRNIIVWGFKWSQSDEDEKVNLAVVMREKGVESKPTKFPTKANLETNSFLPNPKKVLDLSSMVLNQGSRTMTNKKCKLPEGSHKVPPTGQGYEAIHVPPPEEAPVKPEDLVKISDLPLWCRDAFKGATTLNRVQSKVFPVAFGQDDPILLCAPTGAGKTNVDQFAPMKALVQEMVGNFSSRLQYLVIQVGELTGDRQMTKDQITMTQIIVTTPEKWDVITRKSTDTSYTNLVGLIVIDEIHLLHDERGPVLEALRVNPKKGLFFFDSSARPCPLKLEFIGIAEKKAIKRL
ncbi:hypothetical protein PCASD_09492 [Puccinia coronata f. sp. avenae]|uniref:Helicase ATP-binding domain-containing protein n=1 Tax=Puccinia coronata f. sp. avenae TaxID=200324 RepID=A0A2N5UKG2_9BASI|nr:hypothetical protein PCASD_09492 [Puccinia coronata f. sp. avenae]